MSSDALRFPLTAIFLIVLGAGSAAKARAITGGASPAAATACVTSWIPTFGPQVGMTGNDIRAFSVYDDGSGPALFAGGAFQAAGSTPVNGIAKWNGASWSALTSGLGSSGIPEAMTVFDDGSGSQLYVAGDFQSAGGVPVLNIARWNGSTWSAVGTGSSVVIRALAVFDDGSGPALYAGGDFVTIGGQTVNRIAKWNGSSWSALGNGLGTNDAVHALAVFDDGSGPALYAGGMFTSAGGVAANYVAKWNGSTWSALMRGTDYWVYALTVHDDGSGNALYAGGAFSTAGGVNSPLIARWRAAGWSSVGGGAIGIDVHALGVFDDGSGASLYAGGSFSHAGSTPANNIARWNGSTWSALTSGVAATVAPDVRALAVFGSGLAGPNALYVGGHIESAGGLSSELIARWRSSGWSTLGHGLSAAVGALTVFDDHSGGGAALFAGGSFTTAGGVSANRIAKWNGSTWSPLGTGVSGGSQSAVASLLVFDDGGGGGPALYVGGLFGTAGAVSAQGIARWNGSSWSALATGVGGFVDALAVFDDGSGPKLYAAGSFNTAGAATVNHIAQWTGTAWVSVGGGVGGFSPPATSSVRALAVFDDGSGPALYAGGHFLTAGGNTANYVAKWNGTTWSSLAGGTSGQVDSLGVFDDGSGPALYVSGDFSSPANGIAKWNGHAWSALGSGLTGAAETLHVFDDGSGSALYAAGDFNYAGAGSAAKIARWNGASWSALGNGSNDTVFALATFDDGGPGGPALFVGGAFASALDSGDSFLAKWDCVPTASLVPYCFGDGSSAACPCGNSGAAGNGCANSIYSAGARLSATGTASVSNDTVVLSASSMSGTTALFFQGATTRPPFATDDGLGCVGAPIIRLHTQGLTAGAGHYPTAGQPPISVRGALTPADGWRYYQCYYRNAASYCTPAPSNRTNGVAIHWAP